MKLNFINIIKYIKMNAKSIFKNPALTGYLVKKINEKYPGKQVGKTIIQRMMYLLTRSKTVDFDYSMYYYGPFSSEVSGELNFAQDSGIIQIEWVDKKGYFINATTKLNDFDSLITDEEKSAIENITEKFGDFNAIDMSIIASAFFLKDNFGVSDTELVDVIHQTRQNHPSNYIKNVLQKATIL